MAEFFREQRQIIQAPASGSIFLSGPAGSGKTTVGVARLRYLVEMGIPADQILVLTPQRTLAAPYYEEVRSPNFPAGGSPSIVTLGGLAQRLIALFWPMIAQEAHFSPGPIPPTFLTLETAQYFLARLVDPLLSQGYFEAIHIDRNRMLSQVLDNLNKAAGVGFDHTQIADRLATAWIGKPEQLNAYHEAQDCANRFRDFCLENHLLDFSLQMEVFVRHLWPSFLCREYLFRTYRHLIYENVEEDVPVVHDIVSQWMDHFDSALIIYDSEGGYRSFLGADPQSGGALQELCDQVVSFDDNLVTTPPLDTFRETLGSVLHNQAGVMSLPHLSEAIHVARKDFYPELMDWVCQKTNDLIFKQNVPPGEIAILSPFLSDALRFSLMERFEEAGIPSRSHRPSRSLREEPATQCLLALASLAHPQWNLPITHFDVRMALMHAIQNLDLVRADILSKIVFRPNWRVDGWVPFEKIQSDTQERISYQLGERYEILRGWLENYRQSEPLDLDIFLSRLFGEVLSQPGFGFHQNFDSAAVAARLIESIQKFRWAATAFLSQEGRSIGQEYIGMVLEGVIAAQYLLPDVEVTQDAVFIAPAYTFLMANQPVSYQFWLDIGSIGWWERLYQPLTHPVVLSRHWPAGRIWTDSDEVAASQQALDRLVSGLLRRCRQRVFLCSSGLNERGDEPRGPLLQAIQTILRRNADQEGIYAGEA